MANTKISALNSLTKATLATNDVFPVVDTGSTETKKITYQELIQPTDANFRIAGSADNTKLVAFEVDGLTTATTRTITIPDANTTLVGTDTTQTLTNKTLTAPQINMGSDATGDTYYRTAGGAFARLPIGTSGQILQSSSGGIPEWIANPSVTTATTSAAGIVELATTAETETGTDATRAVTPDGLHDMTTLAGAAWFLDEDSMSSDSATKTASQQSIKAYTDNVHTFVPSTFPTNNEWFTYTIPVFGDGTRFAGWVNTGAALTVPTNGGGGWTRLNNSGAGILSASLPGTGSDVNYICGNDIRVKWRIKFDTISGRAGMGIVETIATLYAVNTGVGGDQARFCNDGGVMYAVTSEGTTVTSTNVDSGITDTNWNTYEIIFDPGVNCKFYINGSLVATHTTNLPTGTELFLGFGTVTSNEFIDTTPVTISMKLS